MASPEVLQNDSGSCLSDEYSFVPDADMSNLQNGDINSHHNDSFNFTNMQSALTTPSPDSIEVVEVHSQLSELIDENARLKEKLSKNNSMMEDQISTIKSWRDHMILSKTQTEENLKAAMERISFLVKENSELREKIDDSMKMDEAQKVKSCIQYETVLNNMVPVDCGIEAEQIKPHCSYFNENLCENLKHISEILKIASDLKTNQEEKLILDSYISMLKFKIASLEGDTNQLASLQTDEENGYEVVRVKTHKNETQQFPKPFEELACKLQDKDNELTRLKNEKEELAEKVKEYEVKIKEMETALKSQYETMINKLQNESSLSQKYRERCENLQQQIEEFEVKLEQNRSKVPDDRYVNEYKEEIQQLQAILKLEQQDKEDQKTRYSALMKKCEHLQVDFDRIQTLLEMQTKDGKEKAEKLAAIESDAKKYMEEADFLTAKLLETEEKLEECETELKRLQNEFAQMSDPESIPALKAQIEVYKTDYGRLESAKQAACDEVVRLENELKRYRNGDSSRSMPPENPTSRRSSDQRVEEEDSHTCLICSGVFENPSAVEEHVTRCFEEHISTSETQ